MPEYQLYACLVLASRLAYLRQDTVASTRFSLVLAGAQALLIVTAFGFRTSTAATAIGVMLITLVGRPLETRLSVYSGRIATLALLSMVPIIVQPLAGPLLFSGAALSMFSGGSDFFTTVAGGAPVEASRVLPVLLALLLLANEVNIVMRGVFQALDLVPRVRAPATAEVNDMSGELIDPEAIEDKREYNAGRVIGILERWLMFLIVSASSDWGALGFIVAAKSLVRLDQFKDRVFAEYMLVGTLMSALFAIAAAWAVGVDR